MNESPTKLRAELLAFLEEKDRRRLVPLIGTRVIDCGYQPPRVVGGEEDFVESKMEPTTNNLKSLPRTTDAKSWFDSGWQAHRWQCRWDTVYAALYGLLCGVGVAGILKIIWEG